MSKKMAKTGSKTNKTEKVYRGNTYKPVMYVPKGSRIIAAQDIETGEILKINGKVVSFKSI